MDPKMCLLFLVVCVQSKPNQWTISVPSQITALHGSCVVIPCRYTYPKVYAKWAHMRGFWKRGDTIVASELNTLKLIKEFNKRTKIVGHLASGNCSMILWGVRTKDVGPFYFQSIIQGQTSFSFKQNPVTIKVLKNPDHPTMSFGMTTDFVGRPTVSVSCKVTHMCPASLPKFRWSHDGGTTIQSKRQNRWIWSAESTLSFRRTPGVFNKTVTCRVVRGWKAVTSSVTILW